MAEHRNAVTHMRGDGPLERMTQHEIVDAARSFFRCALTTLKHMAAPEARVFPFVIRIESVHIDRYGRRIITAESDGEAGRVQEIIFTDDAIAPGELYLMRPFTNPWRVDPLLVKAGALGNTPDPAAEVEVGLDD